MPPYDIGQEKAARKRELEVQCQIAFASGLFQGDLTVRTLLESLAEGVVVMDQSGTILLVNTSAVKLFGYEWEDLVGKPYSMLIPERFRKMHAEHWGNFFKEPRNMPMGEFPDITGLRRDGSELYLQVGLGVVETIKGSFILALVSDITLRRQAEKELRESEALFHLQIERVKDYAIYTLDARGNVLNWNSGAEHLKGYSAEEIIGRHFSCFYTEEDRQAGKPEEMLRRARAEGQATDEGWRVRKDGEKFWADVIITALHDESGTPLGFSKVTHDITKRKQAEEALQRYAQRLIVLEEDLRKKIAMELHDDIVQVVAALGYNLVNIENSLHEETENRLRSLLADSSTLTQQIIRTVRNLMTDLYPADLDSFGLAEAVRSYVGEYANRTGIAVAVHIDPEFPRLPAKKETALFRITQEALNNVAKHAVATKVSLALRCEGGSIRLSVSDDGKGFIPQPASSLLRESGWGLSIMRERAQIIGGIFILNTHPGGGTTISVDIREGQMGGTPAGGDRSL